MYPRRRQCQTCISKGGLRSRIVRYPRPPQLPTNLSRFAKVYSPTSRAGQDGRHGPPNRSSIRPITLFAICIPLGYALSWALKTREDVADTDGFVKYTLASKQDVSSTCSIFTFRPSTTSTVRTDDPLLKRVITSVQFKQPQLQIARSYTLLPPTNPQDPRELRFLIRKEQNGEVSGYLHRLPVGSELELRGLSAEYVLPETVDTALFLAGGTGIAPAMQVANALAGEADVHILWANRRREDCAGGISDTGDSSNSKSGLMNWRTLFGLLSTNMPEESGTLDQQKSTVVERLEEMKQSSSPAPSSTQHGKLLVDYYVDEEGSFIQRKDVSRLLQQAGNDSNAGKKLLFVAGPDGFVNHWAASKMWMNGREVQGPLGGVLGTVDLRGWEVVKL